MNLTLSIDENLLKSARKLAVDMDTSVNSLIRDYLQTIVEKQQNSNSLFLDEWMQLMDENDINMTERNWSRDELHESWMLS